MTAAPTSLSRVDDGCQVHPSCLSCPLVQCVLDTPAQFRGAWVRRRDAEIARLFAAGMRVNAIASRYGLTRRSVFRSLARERRARAAGGASICGAMGMRMR